MYMFELTFYGGTGITKWESIIKYYGSPPNIMVMLVISDCRKYYGILSILKLPFISACLCITASFHVSQITVYFGSPEYHGIISYFRSLFISACQPIMASSKLSNHCLLGLPAYHGIYLISWVSYIIAYIGLSNYSDSSVKSSPSISVHQNRLIVVPVQAFMSFQQELAA